MLSLSTRVPRGPNKGRPLALGRNQGGKIDAALDKPRRGRRTS